MNPAQQVNRKFPSVSHVLFGQFSNERCIHFVTDLSALPPQHNALPTPMYSADGNPYADMTSPSVNSPYESPAHASQDLGQVTSAFHGSSQQYNISFVGASCSEDANLANFQSATDRNF